MIQAVVTAIYDRIITARAKFRLATRKKINGMTSAKTPATMLADCLSGRRIK
ncbi:hypothetical protein BMETH_2753_0 [methanotrophic bacterial endosymbiont of Bathymodiolus sp.]|nr:hypothetical protein BMETH_2753_0 [methanotrophic bacterial endosymbiont of Bathymodiolus sp.]